MFDARTLVTEARRILVFTGAGVSTEAGIPDFRSPGGLWSRVDPMSFHIDNFHRDPAAYWRLRGDLMQELDLASRKPTRAHEVVAREAREGRVMGVVTQNIDGLHERAGTPADRLVRLHGSADEVACPGCGTRRPYDEVRGDVEAGDVPPTCPRCGGPMKPGTVLFGEVLPQDQLEQAHRWARACDLCLVVGSSLQVWPAAGVPDAAVRAGARLVIVNHEETPLDPDAHAVVRASASEAVPRLFS